MSRMIRTAVKPMVERYATLPAREFGPKALSTVRDDLVALGWSRDYINKQVAASPSLPMGSRERVCGAGSIARPEITGRAPEWPNHRPRVLPVDDATVEATLPHLPPMVANMVRIQRLTGMRPKELVTMRAAGLDTNDPSCWVNTPESHKTEHHDQERVIFLGPRSIEILSQYVVAKPDGYLFDPRQSESERNEARRSRRRVKLWPSHEARRDRGTHKAEQGIGIAFQAIDALLPGLAWWRMQSTGIRTSSGTPRPR